MITFTTTLSCVSYNRTEKNATPWSKERLKTLLKDLEIETDQGRFTKISLIKL